MYASVNKASKIMNQNLSSHLQLNTEILSLLQEQMITGFPAFFEAFGKLQPCSDPNLETVFQTDGAHLFFHPGLLQQHFLYDPATLRDCYLHVHLHCLCLHVVQTLPVSERDWNLACDLSVRLMQELLTNQNVLRSQCVTLLKKQETSVTASVLSSLKMTGWLDVQTLLPLLDLCPSLKEFASACALDSHCRWYRSPSVYGRILATPDEQNASVSATAFTSRNQSLPAEQITYLEKLLKNWKAGEVKLISSIQPGQHGKSGQKLTGDAVLTRRDSMDYRKFLRRFAVPREEAILDMDSFDYIPYYYGLACYADEIAGYHAAISPDCSQINLNRIPFIEPLEYSEVYRLDELAIAIDTSGSCSGRIVRRFLEETWSILRQRENFFSRMRLHLIQCDLMIQEHRIFTSVEEWEAYLPELKIHGHGDTDFTPVFDYLNKLIAKKEIRHLRGLLYFTDGDGIFPNTAPSWDTAFVFLNDRTEKQEIPAWAIRLNLHLPEEFQYDSQ